MIGTVQIIATGVANTASVCAAFERCGAAPVLTDDPALVREGAAVVLPGVGSFGVAAHGLRARGLDSAVVQRVHAGAPTLAICLGLQLLLDASEESPGVAGLGAAPGTARRFSGPVCVPQLGWNLVTPGPGFGCGGPGYAYFANSYRLIEPPPGWSVAWADHGGPFVAAMRREGVLACQFHPELSGAWGESLLRGWLEGAGAC